MIPDRHAREEERLVKLADCDILDTPPEEVFDRIAYIAAQVCNCPVAVVNLIDRDRQWFKATIGVDVRQTPRDIAFCAHAVASGEPLIVEDATLDPRFHDNPLVLNSPNVRFYAGVPVRADSLPVGTLCVIDSTPRRLTEPQRSALTALAREVETQLDLRRALRRSERLGEQKQELAFMVVHDMRSPLTVALSGAQFLAADVDLPARDRQIVADISIAAQRLERMVRDLLDVSRSDTGRLEPHPEPTSLTELTAQIASATRLAATEHRVTFRSDVEGREASIDASLVRRMIENMLENAIKYAPRSSEVHVEMTVPSPGILRISVSDEGQGIEEAARERIFEAAFRLPREVDVHARTSYGLGLRFCKVAADAMGGRIWVEDNTPTGARFVAEIPMR